MTARIGVVTFPGSVDDRETHRAVSLCGAVPVPLWHASDSLNGVDAVILPGGFSHGDYPRGGSIARYAPITDEVVRRAGTGMPVLGIGNGFQLLCEARLLPGALVVNDRRLYVCREQVVRVDSVDTVWTFDFFAGEEITLVVKHGEGRFVAAEDTLARLEARNQVVLRYVGSTPNGSAHDIAGVTNEHGNVVGVMPHPEHSVAELTGPSLDGRRVFTSVQRFLRALQPKAGPRMEA